MSEREVDARLAMVAPNPSGSVEDWKLWLNAAQAENATLQARVAAQDAQLKTARERESEYLDGLAEHDQRLNDALAAMREARAYASSDCSDDAFRTLGAALAALGEQKR